MGPILQKILPFLGIQLVLFGFSEIEAKILQAPLRFNENGKFKIVNFADLHFGENQDSVGPIEDINSTRVMTDILEWEKPDFVVYTGDQVYGDNLYPNGSAYVDMLLQPAVQGNYRWASVYGNHDHGPNITREEIFATEVKYPNCYTLHAEEGLPGITNYYHLIYPHENDPNQDTPALVLWFFDSLGGHDADNEYPSNVDEAVVAWFHRENQQIMETWGRLPALAFFHIPTIEYGPVQDTISDHPECTGLVDDVVEPQDRDTGFMEALVSSGTVRTAFVGHEHGNAWCCFVETFEICYNRHSGYGGYGNWTRGSRVIQVSLEDVWGSYENYIRMEDGSVIDRFPNPNNQ